MFSKLACFIGLHSYTSWKQSTNKKCLQECFCQRCNKHLQREIHTWTSPQYQIQDDNIHIQITTCQRCDKITKQQQIHIWKIIDYSCCQIHICSQCGKNKIYKKTGQAQGNDSKHTWGNPILKSQNYHSHVQNYTCVVCGEKCDIKEDHEWGEWTYKNATSCRQVYYCQICKEEQEGGSEYHKWILSGYEKKDFLAHYEILKCERCGKLMRSQRVHEADGESNLCVCGENVLKKHKHGRYYVDKKLLFQRGWTWTDGNASCYDRDTSSE